MSRGLLVAGLAVGLILGLAITAIAQVSRENAARPQQIDELTLLIESASPPAFSNERASGEWIVEPLGSFAVILDVPSPIDANSVSLDIELTSNFRLAELEYELVTDGVLRLRGEVNRGWYLPNFTAPSGRIKLEYTESFAQVELRIWRRDCEPDTIKVRLNDLVVRTYK